MSDTGLVDEQSRLVSSLFKGYETIEEDIRFCGKTLLQRTAEFTIGEFVLSQPPLSSLNTFVVFAAIVTVPSGFTTDSLPVGLTFFGKPYTEPTLIKLAYAYEQATHHRVPPKTTPPLAGR